MWPFQAFNIDNQGLKEEDFQESFCGTPVQWASGLSDNPENHATSYLAVPCTWTFPFLFSFFPLLPNASNGELTLLCVQACHVAPGIQHFFLERPACTSACMHWQNCNDYQRETFSGCYLNASLNLYYQALVVQTLNSAIHWINLYPADSAILICWIIIYPVDSAIQCLNNRDQNLKGLRQPDCIISGPKM